MRIYEKYNTEVDITHVSDRIKKLTQKANSLTDKTILSNILGLIDLTILNSTDNKESVSAVIDKVNDFPSSFPELPNVAGICVYPTMVHVVKKYLKEKKVKIVSVAGSFPSSQTFLDVKLLEVKNVLAEGASEIDVVLSVGEFIGGNYDYVFDEIHQIKAIAGKSTVKVIIESGILKELKLIKKATFLALEAGADFIKTSTGKSDKGANPESVWVISEAIKEYAQVTGRFAGIKPAGGISGINSALLYYLIVNEILGVEWVRVDRFRFGASKLANLVLGENYF